MPKLFRMAFEVGWLGCCFWIPVGGMLGVEPEWLVVGWLGFLVLTIGAGIGALRN